MKTASVNFNSIVESIYNLPLEYKKELKSLLEHNISDDRREEIMKNFKSALKEHKAGAIKFSASMQELKKMR